MSSSNNAVSFLSLYKYSDTRDKLLILAGCLSAIITGLGMPIQIVVYGELVDVFVEFTSQGPNGTMTTDIFLSKCYDISWVNLGLGFLYILLGYVFVACLSHQASRQTYRIKLLFYESLLRQEMGWFDDRTSGDFASRITSDLKRIEDGIGEKVGLTLNMFVSCIVCIVTAFIYGWELSLVVCAFAPLIAISTAMMSKAQATFANKEAEAYAASGSIAQEVISLIKTVFAFEGQEKELKRYESSLIPAKVSGIKRNLVTGLGMGLSYFFLYLTHGVGVWYGAKMMIATRESGDNQYTGGTVLIIFWNVMMLGFFFGMAAPYFEAFQMARGSATSVYEVIDRKSAIDSSSEEGQRPDEFKATIEFKNVSFIYPSRAEVQTLKGIDIRVEEGETVAVVGPSGSGKSTLVQLIQRFYETSEGQILVGGVDVRDLNLEWYRNQIGVVGQEPVLFDTTVAENISLGLCSREATEKEIMDAAIESDAHSFLSKLPSKYQTLVGDRGAQMSGGQKQRIAIARALIRKPKILLLDEATSALDRESESAVQTALDKARIGRTTIIVAHRLTTVQSADRIIVMDKGEVVETGTHSELIAKSGLYHKLFDSQQNIITKEIVDEDLETQDTQPLSLHKRVSVCSAIEENAQGVVREDEEESETKDEEYKFSQMRIFRMIRGDMLFVAIGCLGATGMGMMTPLFALLLAAVTDVFEVMDNQVFYDELVVIAYLFGALGTFILLSAFLMVFMFGLTSERLIMKLRKMAFKAILGQDVAWFDRKENSCGALCAQLSSDASSIQGLSGSRIGTICQSLATLVGAVGFSLYFSWRFGLLLGLFVPLLVFASILESRFNQGNIAEDRDVDQKAAEKVVEVVSSIKTVTSLHQQKYFNLKFESTLINQLRGRTRKSHILGLALGFSRGFPILAYAAAFFYGSYLISVDLLHYSDFIRVSEALLYGALSIGQSSVFASDYEKAKMAAKNIFKLVDGTPMFSRFGGITRKSCEGSVEYAKVHFQYPTRTESKVLKGLSISVAKGQTVALVGSSGSGKSTVFQLLQKFYTCTEGQVLVDGVDLKALNTSWIRSKLGLVSQEPLLFGCSISQNIAYGDNSRQVEFKEIVAASQKANIHSFINDLPEGYDTTVGEKGGQLSGGQKQRIAIARALLRNPAILLLDEATAALDTESEQIVQEALDEARLGRTCLVIAHRLSTIRNADKIYVLDKGVMIEEGTHDEMVEKRGFYYQLLTAQCP